MTNSRYKDGDYEAVHQNPVWRDRADYVIAADVTDEGESQAWEQIWARKIGATSFEICCIPFFAYGLALGDEVAVDQNDVIQRVTRASGHHTLRVWFGDISDAAKARSEVLGLLESQHNLSEWFSSNLIAIDASTEAIGWQLLDQLTSLETALGIHVETGRPLPMQENEGKS